MGARRGVRAGAAIAVALLASARSAAASSALVADTAPPGSAPAARPDDPGRIAERMFDSAQGLAPGWMDYGYAPRQLKKGGPVEIDLSNHGGLILARPGLAGEFGAVVLRYKAPPAFGEFLEVQLQSPSGDVGRRVPVERRELSRREDGFVAVSVPIEALNPRGEPFDRVMVFAGRPVGRDRVLLDGLALTAAPPRPPEPARAGRFVVDCGAPGHPISPLVYGVGGASGTPWTSGATARRWGGNPTTRYNWERHAWNAANDWFFKNTADPSGDYERFLDENLERGLQTALTVPMLGWVAKDASSYSFPVSIFGPQQRAAPENPDAGNGVGRDGKLLPPGPPFRTSVVSTAESVERWVRTIRERDRARGTRSVQSYILDNEPMLWHETHRDVHPEPVTYDELLEKTIAYATAIRRADPEAKIAGPAEWGWIAYHHSARDIVSGVRLRPDRRRHGDVPLIPWYLRRIREHERRTGVKLLDLLDVHFYPQAERVGIGSDGATDPATSALRIRTTRSLWDPTYRDESWIAERMRVLPLLREWVAENAPGLGISIGEWNFGAEHHMSGGLAVAEALGRFGAEGLASAYYWTQPPERSPAFWAFRAYRNFDGAGGRFGDRFVPARSDVKLGSLFASRDGDRRVVAVLLNHAPLSPLAAHVELERCGRPASVRAFTYSGDESGFAPHEASLARGAVGVVAAPYTMTVVELAMVPER